MRTNLPKSRAGRALTFVLAAVSVVIVIAAERDLHGRDADEVRGDKRLWRLVCLNALGAIAYFAAGRRVG